jgi:uncharacterized membrane protein
MGIALASLAGVFISAYLWLYKLGRIGTLNCGTGGCETVQLSPYSRFAGVEVALIGLVGYLVILGIALVALRPDRNASAGPARLLAVVSGGGLLFTLYLKYLEFFVIHAVCRWCVASAALILVIFILACLDLRQVRTVR